MNKTHFDMFSMPNGKSVIRTSNSSSTLEKCDRPPDDFNTTGKSKNSINYTRVHFSNIEKKQTKFVKINYFDHIPIT